MRDLIITVAVSLFIVVAGWRFWQYQQNVVKSTEPADVSTEEELTNPESTTSTEESLENQSEKTVTPSTPVAPVAPVVVPPVPPVSIAPAKTVTSKELSLSVLDQKAGTKVALTGFTLPGEGWVAVHDNNGGKPGNVLGAHLFGKGAGVGTIDLLRGTVAGTLYIVALHKDNGDRKFSNREDAIYVNELGLPVTMKFTAQ